MQGRRRINAKHIDLMLRVVVCSEENGCLFVIKASAPFNLDSGNGNKTQLHLRLPVAPHHQIERCFKKLICVSLMRIFFVVQTAFQLEQKQIRSVKFMKKRYLQTSR